MKMNVFNFYTEKDSYFPILSFVNEYCEQINRMPRESYKNLGIVPTVEINSIDPDVKHIEVTISVGEWTGYKYDCKSGSNHNMYPLRYIEYLNKALENFTSFMEEKGCTIIWDYRAISYCLSTSHMSRLFP